MASRRVNVGLLAARVGDRLRLLVKSRHPGSKALLVSVLPHPEEQPSLRWETDAEADAAKQHIRTAPRT